MFNLKLTTYLDEVAEEPQAACAALATFKITNVVIRHVWSGNICQATDSACQSLKALLKAHGLSVEMIASELGLVPADELMRIPGEIINRTFDIASYFNAKNIRIFVGSEPSNSMHAVDEWMQMISERAIAANIVPLLEITHKTPLYKPADAVQLFNKYKRWRILYDPAQFIIKQAQDPFVKYWTLLKRYVDYIDLHDYKIGHGHKPIGYGDAKIISTMKDAKTSNFSGWYCLEPALGRKYGSAITRTDVFKIALSALEAVMNAM